MEVRTCVGVGAVVLFSVLCAWGGGDAHCFKLILLFVAANLFPLASLLEDPGVAGADVQVLSNLGLPLSSSFFSLPVPAFPAVLPQTCWTSPTWS